MKFELKKANIEDAELIWKMQIKSFAKLLEKYEDYDTNPGNEPLEKIIYRFNQSYTSYYLIVYEDSIVGAIRVADRKDNSLKKIAPIFVLPEYQNKGIAQLTIKEIEKIHGENNWELDTILQEEGNCHLYEKMGYKRTGKTQVVNEKLTLVFYEKR